MLSDAQIRTIKPQVKPLKLFDGGGLHLFVSPTGSKHWRLKYRFAGKEKLLSFGPYPRVTLARARTLRERAKDALAAGLDPSLTHKISTATTQGRPNPEIKGPNSGEWTRRDVLEVLHSLQPHILPLLHGKPLANIRPDELITSEKMAIG